MSERKRMSMASMLSPAYEEDGGRRRSGNEGPPVSAALLQAAAQASAQESGEDSAEGHASDSHPKRVKRSRACQACRGMKIRCLPVEGQEACKACAKVNRECVMPGPARKRQKTVHKVAELEKKINALTASLAAKQQGSSEPTPPTDSPQMAGSPSTRPAQHVSPRSKADERGFDQGSPDTGSVSKASCAGVFQETSVGVEYEDVITRGKISLEMAYTIFERWRRDMCPLCPIVAFPESTSIHWLRAKRPILLLAILGIACDTVCPELQSDLIVELSRQLADRVAFYHERSLDLIQALMVYPIWYGKHKLAKDLGYSHYIQSAITMSLDIGMGKRSREGASRIAEDIENRRTWMGCYFLSTCVATVSRLPIAVRFSTYLEESLEILAKNPVLPGDRIVCSLVRLASIMESVSTSFHMDDPCSTISLSDSRTQYHLKLFELQVKEWRADAEELVPKTLLDQYHSILNLYVHEIALHNDHNVDDFRPSALQFEAATKSLDQPASKDFLTNSHFEALATCVESMENALTAFTATDRNIFRCLPIIHMVWMAYVAIAMIKLHAILSAPGSKYGAIFLSRINIGGLLDACTRKLGNQAKQNPNSASQGFFFVFQKLRVWYAHKTANESGVTMATVAEGLRDKVHSKEDTTKPRRQSQNSKQYYPSSANITTADAMPAYQDPQTTFSYPAPPWQLQQPSNTSSDNTNDNSHTANANTTPPINSNSNLQQQQLHNNQSLLLDSTNPIDPSAFDIDLDVGIGDWGNLDMNFDLNMNMKDLNNFDSYMYDVGWIGHLI